MFKQELFVQSPQNKGEIFYSLMKTATSVQFSEVEILMAYASYKGCVTFNNGLNERITNWSKIKKRWIISIDGGVTEARALEFLQNLNNSEVRVPNAKEVLNRNLKPKNLFHHKLFLFDAPKKSSFGLYTGSPNLTANGLYNNNEQATSIICYPNFSIEEGKKIAEIYKVKSVIQNYFEIAEPLSNEILRKYEIKAKRPKFSREDDNELLDIVQDEYSEVTIPQGISLATSNFLWVEVGTGISNYQVGSKGNQLDLQRGVRTFFGFSSSFVSPNTIFGSVSLEYRGNYYQGTLKFGNNQMDKLNLPPCNSHGPTSYVNQTLLFRRKTEGGFEIKVGREKDKIEWRKKSKEQKTYYELKSGRAFGVFR